ncbi:uncharacterized protein MKK02DRAFT_29295 [Dioszegia hungarica]|uniref:Uncharacterized protein n=1 Tax=Dioszegia hungarica TaxID=4972 RepID=A0AA38HGL7_9TREE|nr:uncharacterized protein MKK02DRAFT_29295 [Dioszegia hungarica]KAI9639184.1 hypothetical protein MKK02DRAFT_29295 [Dioszegia hungarica]
MNLSRMLGQKPNKRQAKVLPGISLSELARPWIIDTYQPVCDPLWLMPHNPEVGRGNATGHRTQTLKRLVLGTQIVTKDEPIQGLRGMTLLDTCPKTVSHRGVFQGTPQLDRSLPEVKVGVGDLVVFGSLKEADMWEIGKEQAESLSRNLIGYGRRFHGDKARNIILIDAPSGLGGETGVTATAIQRGDTFEDLLAPDVKHRQSTHSATWLLGSLMVEPQAIVYLAGNEHSPVSTAVLTPELDTPQKGSDSPNLVPAPRQLPLRKILRRYRHSKLWIKLLCYSLLSIVAGIGYRDAELRLVPRPPDALIPMMNCSPRSHETDLWRGSRVLRTPE